ncbi:hypothetical protein AX16_004211 [Volvariella volvacea WC 439]|nr:hypothetical protein AX16_004211 [Volvariella volvacea WC 439]
MLSPSSSPSSYVCDTLPPAKLAAGSNLHPPSSPTTQPALSPPIQVVELPMEFQLPVILEDDLKQHESEKESTPPPSIAPQPPPRKLCVRHQRMADEGTNLKLQQSLDALPVEEREAVNAVWSNFSSSSHPRRALILQGLLTMCCFSQLSLLTEQLSQLIRIDPFTILPREVSLKILSYLDAISLCRAAQVTKRWKALADDDVLWRGICEQHIGQKCKKCGWSLPVLEKKRSYRPSPCPPSPCPPSPSHSTLPSPPLKRPLEEDQSPSPPTPPIKRQRSDDCNNATSSSPDVTRPTPPTSVRPSPSSHTLLAPQPGDPNGTLPSITRPWKSVYSERMTVERNWRRGRCTVRTLRGHTDGVMCLQYSETLSHPAFPVLITGSYDRTVRVWNMETGTELHCLKGHTRAVRALQFDECKLITGSMDNTIKVWDWRRGKCIRTLSGHSDGVVCLNFDSNVLASGSADSTVKVWNLRTGGAFTLRGHTDWVNAVQLWDSNCSSPGNGSTGSSLFDVSSPRPSSSGTVAATPGCSAPQIDPGKMLFSASDDGTIRLWDLNLRTCVRQFTGHVGQVQSMKLLLGNCDEIEEEAGCSDEKEAAMQVDEANKGTPPMSTSLLIGEVNQAPSPQTVSTRQTPPPPAASNSNRKKPVLISGSLDNTIKVWDIDTGKTLKTLFGHIEGVWAVASDKVRIVSGSHDRTLKVWSREDGKCTSTLVGHQAAVSCLALGEDKIVSGSDDCTIKIWSFGG